jgi:putative hydrolase of the HAD superfamily
MTSASAPVQPTIIYDYDDTLGGVMFPDGSIHPGAQAYFDIIERQKAMVNSIGLDGERYIQLQHDIDLVLAKQHGFGDKTRFATSFVMAFADLATATDNAHLLTESMKTAIYDLGMAVFRDYPYHALEGALEVLDKTSRFYRIAIVTKGEYSEQMKKLKDSGCGAYADHIYVVPKKDENDWNGVLTDLGYGTEDDASESWAIGNSAKADVNPLLRRGFNGIEIAEKNKWTFEQADMDEPMYGRVAKVITDISAVLDIVPLPSY